ncbi:hypothetical protein SAMN05421739_101475 [Pontibacter chinhatensis]|uniref:Uncharacterized protein n=1 Tax=Pontibacter chinhatensis TaxID=1436961 RepID=A0A1I2MVD0_9BACT|nr:hypothetical protein SAMN05421739_101475 [Pontibacter chinhatensis]
MGFAAFVFRASQEKSWYYFILGIADTIPGPTTPTPPCLRRGALLLLMLKYKFYSRCLCKVLIWQAITPLYELCSQASNSRSHLSSRGQFLYYFFILYFPVAEAMAIEPIPAFGLSASRGSGAELEARQPEARGQEAKAARCSKASPLGLESSKARYETSRLWELEDERQLVRIACVKLREAAAKKV